jgi:hypothetical protein
MWIWGSNDIDYEVTAWSPVEIYARHVDVSNSSSATKYRRRRNYLQRLPASCFLYCHLIYVLLLTIYIFCNLLFITSPGSHYIRIENFASQRKSQTYFAGCVSFSPDIEYKFMSSQMLDVLTTHVCTARYNRKESFLPSRPIYDFVTNPLWFYWY